MERWTAERANAWYEQQPWMAGANYVPSDAVNNVEMWRKETFNPGLIRKELTWAAQAGINSLRVFLSYHVWKHEGDAFLDTFEAFLRIADECGHTVMPILFDDCAFDGGADPVYGPQPEPIPNIHNSRWVPSPGQSVQDDPAQLASCKAYLDAVIGAYRDDRRIILWDLYNEPGNTDRVLQCLPLLVSAFRWARAHAPVQPLCASIYNYSDSFLPINLTIGELSDIINLHTYMPPSQSRLLIEEARARGGRPVIVTEWLHRPNGDTLSEQLPYYHANRISAWQWGLVNGRTQTHLDWRPERNANGTSDPWQHDLFRSDGTPYDPEEVALLRRLTGRD